MSNPSIKSLILHPESFLLAHHFHLRVDVVFIPSRLVNQSLWAVLDGRTVYLYIFSLGGEAEMMGDDEESSNIAACFSYPGDARHNGVYKNLSKTSTYCGFSVSLFLVRLSIGEHNYLSESFYNDNFPRLFTALAGLLCRAYFRASSGGSFQRFL